MPRAGPLDRGQILIAGTVGHALPAPAAFFKHARLAESLTSVTFGLTGLVALILITAAGVHQRVS